MSSTRTLFTTNFLHTFVVFTLLLICIFPRTQAQINPAPTPIDPAVQQALDSLSSQIATLNQSVQANSQGLGNVRANISTIGLCLEAVQSGLSDLLSRAQTLAGQTLKLEKVNKIWGNNFRIVNGVFERLKKKVVFKWSPLLSN